MPEKAVVEYIKDNLAKGYQQTQVRDALIAQGRPAKDVDEAFAEALGFVQDEPEPAPQKEETHLSTHVRRITFIVGLLLLLASIFYAITTFMR